MAPDPIIYCLENLTDYVEFERLCSDLMGPLGFVGLEPLGGAQDKGRDAIHVDRSRGETTIFAYSVREDWKRKLSSDAEKVRKHGHQCDRFIFLTTAHFSATERDSVIGELADTFEWGCELFGIERLATMLRSTHGEIVAKHPAIFSPPFFPTAGGLSLASFRDHIVVDHANDDAALAHWASRRLMLLGYLVWCRGLSPLAGESVDETLRKLLQARATKYVCILSPSALREPDLSARRAYAHGLAEQMGRRLVVPAIAGDVDQAQLDHATRRLKAAEFNRNWAHGLRELVDVLEADDCPQRPAGAQVVLSSYSPPDLVRNEPEQLASNLFPVTDIPPVIKRFRAGIPLVRRGDLGWAYRHVSDRELLAFAEPPVAVAEEFRIRADGGLVWSGKREIDGVRTDHLIKELLKKSMFARCCELGLKYCETRELWYFPHGLLKNDALRYEDLDGKQRWFAVAGSRKHGRDRARFRHELAPTFRVLGASASVGLDVAVRIRVRISDLETGKLYAGHSNNARRKKVCKNWWNDKWFARVLGVMSFLAQDQDHIVVGLRSKEQLRVSANPRVWDAPVMLDEEVLGSLKVSDDDDDA